MNHLDDNELIDGLKTGLSRRTADVHAPDGLTSGARRIARRRSATRAVSAGVPMFAAAGVATALLTSSGGQTTRPVIAPAGSGANVAVVRGHDTAYIVKRVRAAITDTTAGTLVHQYEYASGAVSADGSLTSLGATVDDLYDYTAPDGTEYIHNTEYQASGAPYLTAINVLTPDGSGARNDTRTIIDPVNHTYSQTQASDVAPSDGPTPNLDSSPSQVQQALQDEQVIQQGTVTLNGSQAIVLAIALPSGSGAEITLYVDAERYQPLRSVETFDGHPALLVADWLPASPNNVALAKADLIPAGYARTDATN